jgi:hypothetical protein
MADTQTAPSLPQGPIAAEESVEAAHNAILGLLDSETEQPNDEEEQTSEEEESTEETQDELSEDEEGLEDPEVEEEEEEESEEESEEDTLYAVRVDGAEYEVSLDELLKGYSRQSDYTKKTQEVANQRGELDQLAHQFTSEVAQIQAERQQYIESLQSVLQGSMSDLDHFATMDWQSLKESNPLEYVTKRDEYREAQDRISALQQEQSLVRQRQQEEETQLRTRTLSEEHNKLVEKMPEWGESSTKQQMATDLRDYASAQGFIQEEIESLIDHRSLIVLHKAMMYDKLDSGNVRKKKVVNKPKVVRSGKGESKKQDVTRKRNAQMKRLQETGHVDDSVGLFEEFVEL